MGFTHDVIVIGAGAGGLTAAGGCALFGLKVALIERAEMGGECLNNGCVPSKALITAAKRAATANIQTRFGVQLGAPRIDWPGVHAHIHETIARIAPHDSVERFEEMGCDVYRGHATFVGKRKVQVGETTLSAPRIVIATGSAPSVPPIEGLDQVPYLTNENIWDLQVLPQHLVIVGGGAIGMEMAQSFRRLGSEVTVIEPGALLSRDDPDSVAVVVDRMEAEGVMFVRGKAAKVVRFLVKRLKGVPGCQTAASMMTTGSSQISMTQTGPPVQTAPAMKREKDSKPSSHRTSTSLRKCTIRLPRCICVFRSK